MNINTFKVGAVAVLAGWAIGVGVFASGIGGVHAQAAPYTTTTTIPMAATTIVPTVATTTPVVGGSADETFEAISQEIQSIIAEESAAPSSDFVSSGEADDLLLAITDIQNILSQFTPNTISTPFH